MFMVSLFWSLMQQLGLANKEGKVLLLGLDNAGKTTLLYRLKDGRVNTFIPTQRANIEKFEYGGVSFKAFDLGGHEAVRRLWGDFAEDVDAVIFVVDSADAGRIGEAREELHRILGEDGLQDTPVMVLGNKADIPTALPHDALFGKLGIEALRRRGETRLFVCSMVLGTGFEDAMKWVAAQL